MSDLTTVTYCSASTPFGSFVDRNILDLEQALIDRADYIECARENCSGFDITGGMSSSSCPISPLGCCPMLPVPDNACPAWDVWYPIIRELRRYDRDREHSWVRIVFLWRVLAIMCAFTFGMSSFRRINSAASSLRSTYMGWHGLNVLLKSNRSPYADLSSIVARDFEAMKAQDALMLQHFEIPM